MPKSYQHLYRKFGVIMNTFFRFKSIYFIALAVINLFPLIAYTLQLTEGIDYNYGNGRVAPVAEGVAKYAHKDEALDHFTKRRQAAIMQLKSILSSKKNDVLIDYRNMAKIKANYITLDMNSLYTRGSGEKIRFLTQTGLEKCQVFLINRKFYHYNDRKNLVPYNSQQTILDGFTGDIILMDQQGNIFIHPKEMDYIHHSSFFSQKPIAFGAMVRIRNGELMRNDFNKDDLSKVTLFPARIKGSDSPEGLLYYSGHYDPSSGTAQVKNQIKQDALENFKEQLTMIHLITQDLDRSDQIEFIKRQLTHDSFVPHSIKLARKCQELGYPGYALRVIKSKLDRLTKEKYQNANKIEELIIMLAKINTDLPFITRMFIDGESVFKEACNLYKALPLASRSYRAKIKFFYNNSLLELADSLAREYVDYAPHDHNNGVFKNDFYNQSCEEKIKNLVECNFRKYAQIVAERYAVNCTSDAPAEHDFLGLELDPKKTKEEKIQFLEMHGFNDIATELRKESRPCSIQ